MSVKGSSTRMLRLASPRPASHIAPKALDSPREADQPLTTQRGGADFMQGKAAWLSWKVLLSLSMAESKSKIRKHSKVQRSKARDHRHFNALRSNFLLKSRNWKI